MPRTQTRRTFSIALRSRAVTLGLVIVAGAVCLALGREAARRVAVQQELDRLTGQITEAESSTKGLERLLATLQSATYEEGEARTKRNLMKPGENVLVIPTTNVVAGSTNADTQGPGASGTTKPNNSSRWWNFIFHTSDQS